MDLPHVGDEAEGTRLRLLARVASRAPGPVVVVVAVLVGGEASLPLRGL